MLGIIIGVSAVIIIMSLGAGAQSLILGQVKSLGTNIIGVMPGKSEKNAPPAAAMGVVVTTLTYDDAMAIKKIPHISGVVAYSKGVANVSYGKNNFETNISGTTADHLFVEDSEMLTGRFFNKKEETNLARVAVLGYGVKKDLFGATDPIGKKIKIKNLKFEVIGVTKEKGKVAFQDYDNQIFIPIITMQKSILGVNHIGLLRAKVDQKENILFAMEEVRSVLRQRHHIKDKSGDNDDFTVRSSDEALEIISVVTNSLNYFLGAMAALSLLVGGIGIMNIMIISVNERTREIGLRKAVGAKNINILSEFLVESVFLTLIGGLVGVLLGIVISFMIFFVINKLGYDDWQFIVSPISIIVALLVSGTIGFLFGLYPAKKASKLSPMEALRYE